MSLALSLAVLVAAIGPAAAQISSACNPLNTTVTCPPNPALGIYKAWNFVNETLKDTKVWNVTNGNIDYSDGGAHFTIAKRGDAPTIKSNFYFLWGGSSISMKAAPGRGIVSSVTYLSDDHDEIDWEWIGGNNTHVQTNYFGKGNITTYDRAIWVPVDDPINKYHNYSINWSKTELQWLIDGNVVRSLPVAKANGNGEQYPQTPMDVRMGIWAGGDDTLPGNSNWTADWAGGKPDYSGVPFTMSVQSLSVDDGTPGAKEYTWSDKTGKWQSIKVAMGNSTAADAINAPPEQSIVEKFNGLSTATKIGIAAGVGGAVLLLAVLCTICCLRKRKAGRRERDVADADWDRANSEMMAYRQEVNTPQDQNPNPFSDSKTDLHPQSHGFQHGGYHAPPSPNPQYAPLQHRY